MSWSARRSTSILALLAASSANAWADGSTTGDDQKLWVSPVRFASVEVRVRHEHVRDYTTLVRPRDVVGQLALSCENGVGAPCGHGFATISRLETALGYSELVTGVFRLRGTLGTDAYDETLEIERAYITARPGPIAFTVGRNALRFGPGARTNLSWSDHAPPLDHVHVATAYPLPLTRDVALSADYVVGRLRPPQTLDGNLVTIAHAQLDVRHVQLGLIQLLQLGGGGTHLGFWNFVEEHLHRRDSSASETDSSNRRFGGDVSLRIPSLFGAKLYYAVIFEDIRRRRLVDAVRYDADHLLGIELTAIGPGQRHGATLEWHQTGVRSYEHTPRVTGFTNGGFVVGAPLGPDAESLYVGARLRFASFTLYPWVELARLSSDTYEFIVDGPINKTTVGEDEGRFRIGTRAQLFLRDNLWVEAEGVLEHVDDFAFEAGVSRKNAGVTASIIWFPDGPLGRLDLN